MVLAKGSNDCPQLARGLVQPSVTFLPRAAERPSADGSRPHPDSRAVILLAPVERASTRRKALATQRLFRRRLLREERFRPRRHSDYALTMPRPDRQTPA